MISKSSPTMNHHFDSYHQNQNDFDHLSPADVNSALKKTLQQMKTQKKTQKTAFFLIATQGTAYNLNVDANCFRIKKCQRPREMKKSPRSHAQSIFAFAVF